jgi:hypothetical protein
MISANFWTGTEELKSTMAAFNDDEEVGSERKFLYLPVYKNLTHLPLDS